MVETTMLRELNIAEKSVPLLVMHQASPKKEIADPRVRKLTRTNVLATSLHNKSE